MSTCIATSSTGGGHVRLLDTVQKLAGFVVLSGYPSDLYDYALKGWRRVTSATYADGARPRTEVLWINPRCAQALDRMHAGEGSPLFARAAE
jgi:DNA adenine methylase